MGPYFSAGICACLATGLLVAPADAAPRTTDYAPVIQTLTDEITTAMQDNGVVGLTISLVDGKRVVWQRGFGYADRATRRPVTASTLFHIGSASKTASAIAVMQLVERGVVDLDEPLATYVPQFRLLPRFRRNSITVRSVLDHHSGIPGDVFNGMLTVGKPQKGFRKWLVKALASMYPERRVNTVYAYNNSGYVLLQNLVENVTGLPFQRYARRHLFQPAGMSSSTFRTTAAPASRLTRNYQASVTPDGSVKVSRQPREYINGWTAGSITSSAADMARYMQMLLAGGMGMNGQVLKPTTLQRMWRPQVDSALDISFMKFGLGFAVGDPGLEWAAKPGKVVWHDGATVWNHSMMKLLPASAMGVFVSVNTTAPGAVQSAIATRALSLAYSAKTGRPLPQPQEPPRSDPVVASDLERLEGYYAATSSLYRVDAKGAGLELTSNAGTAQPVSQQMRAHADGWFRPVDGSLPMVRFRTVEGRHLMLMRLSLDGAMVTLIGGERLPSTTVTAPWRGRLGRYVAVDANPHVDPTLLAREIRLRDLNGLLVMDLSSEGGIQPLTVRKDGVAFTAGLGFGLGRGKGECVIPGRNRHGAPTFTYLAVTYKRIGR